MLAPQVEVMERLLAYWKARLSDAPTQELPPDRLRPVVQSFRRENQQFSLSPDLAVGLEALSQREGVTLLMTLVAAFQVLLHCYSGQDDIVIGTPSAGRSRIEPEGLVGFSSKPWYCVRIFQAIRGSVNCWRRCEKTCLGPTPIRICCLKNWSRHSIYNVTPQSQSTFSGPVRVEKR